MTTRQFKLYTFNDPTPVLSKDAPTFNEASAEMLSQFVEINERRAERRALDKIQKRSHKYGVGRVFYLREYAGEQEGEQGVTIATWRVETDSEDGGVPNLFRQMKDGKAI